MPDHTGKYRPFSALREMRAAPPAAPTGPARVSSEQPIGRLFVREEFDAAEQAMLLRIIGIGASHQRAIGAALREALGVAVMLEGRDLLAMCADGERVAGWLRERGAAEVVLVARKPGLSEAGREGGMVRAQITRGLRVAVVLKADQGTGALTEGTVRDILTGSPVHPRGIKVRLESGQVGRVRRILG